MNDISRQSRHGNYRSCASGIEIFTEEEIRFCFEESKKILSPVLDLERSNEFKLVPKMDPESLNKADVLIDSVRSSKILADFVFSDDSMALYVRKLNEAYQVNDFQPYPLATNRVRVNFPGAERTDQPWHQDMGTWCTEKNKLWNEISFALWVPFTHVERDENGLELIENSDELGLRNYVKTRSIKRNYSSLPSEWNSKAVNYSVNAGHGILFNSLIFHRTVPAKNLCRVSFDVRFYSPSLNENSKRPSIDVLVTLKRAIPGLAAALRLLPLGI